MDKVEIKKHIEQKTGQFFDILQQKQSPSPAMIESIKNNLEILLILKQLVKDDQ